jgi:cytochrome c-type biogenesis protein CcmE
VRAWGTASSTRFRAGVVVAAVAVALGVLGWTGLDESLVYYRTPTEVAESPPGDGQRIRLGGLVVPGSVHRSAADGSLTMQVTDGVTEITVLHSGSLPQIFEEGQGAVVEGVLDGSGRLHSDHLMVRHSNEYRPPDDTTEGGS